jgi:hypothetical protein
MLQVHKWTGQQVISMVICSVNCLLVSAQYVERRADARQYCCYNARLCLTAAVMRFHNSQTNVSISQLLNVQLKAFGWEVSLLGPLHPAQHKITAPGVVRARS